MVRRGICPTTIHACFCSNCLAFAAPHAYFNSFTAQGRYCLLATAVFQDIRYVQRLFTLCAWQFFGVCRCHKRTSTNLQRNKRSYNRCSLATVVTQDTRPTTIQTCFCDICSAFICRSNNHFPTFLQWRIVYGVDKDLGSIAQVYPLGYF